MKATKIEWADHTINFWWGCSKVSPACANCYAETMARRMGSKVFGQEVEWGAGKPRAERLAKAREEALTIQRVAAKFAAKHGRRPRVFVNSMSDWLDEAVPVEWLAHLLETLHLCPAVDFMLLTKRPENWPQWIDAVLQWIQQKPWLSDAEGYGQPWQSVRDWAADWFVLAKPPANVWIGVTVENQECAEARIPALLKIPARVRFLSCEPLLGPVNLERFLWDKGHDRFWPKTKGERVDWIIAGGESGPGARHSHPEWLYGLRDECQAAGVPFFFKQWGEWLPCGFEALHLPSNGKYKHSLAIQEKGISPRNADMIRVGKAKAGRKLQGREWNEFPKAIA